MGNVFVEEYFVKFEKNIQLYERALEHRIIYYIGMQLYLCCNGFLDGDRGRVFEMARTDSRIFQGTNIILEFTINICSCFTFVSITIYTI